MPIQATFTADFSKWDASLKSAQAGLKSFEVTGKGVQRQLETMAKSFSGVNIKKEADIAVAAVKAVGGVTALTAAEQKKVNATVTEAIAKYHALGQQAPADLKKLQAETAHVEKATSGLIGSVIKIGGALAAAFTVTAITNAIGKTVEYASTIKDMSNQTGIGVERLQELKFAAEQSGVSFESVGTAIFNIQKSLGKGGDGVVGALAKLGLSMKDIRSLRPEDQFQTIASKLGALQNEAERVQVGTALMGKAFKDVLPLIREGIDEQIQKAKEWGVVIDENAINALENMGDAWEAVKLQGTAFIAQALVPMVPAITNILSALGPFVAKLGELPILFDKAKLAALNFAKAQAEGAETLLQLSKITNPIGALTGQIDEQIKQARLAAFFLGNDIKILEKHIANGGKTAAKAGDDFQGLAGDFEDVSDAAAKAAKEAEKAYQEWAKSVTGLGAAMSTAQLEQRLARLTREGKLNDAAIKNIVKEYETLRATLPRVGGALEDLRNSTIKAITPLQVLQRQLQTLGMEAMPDAVRMFKAGQAAVDNLTRSGALLSRTIVDLKAGMSAMPAILNSTAVTATDLALREKEAAAAAELWRANLEDLAGAFATLAQVAPGALGTVAGFLGEVTGSLNLAVKGMDSLNDGMKALDDGETVAGIAGIASGILGIAAAAISAGQAIADLFHSRVEKTMARVAYEFGVSISEELAQGIEDTAVELFGGNRQASKIFHLDQILSEGGGLDSRNIDEMFARFRDLFSMVQTGAFSAAQAIEVLDKNFQTFADFVTKGGSLASQELLDMIRLTEEFGLKSAEVSAFVVSETGKALGGLTTFLNNAKVTTQAAADGIAASLFGIFEAMTANGVSAADAIHQIEPLIKKLDEQLKASGLSGGAAFQQIKDLAAVASHEIAGPLITGVLGLEKALTGLHNSGVLTEEMFDGLTASVADTYKQILKTGVDGAKALQLIAPSLQTIWELQQDFGHTVDANTQKLLDEAVAAGVVGDKHRTATEQMLKLTERMADSLDKLVELFGETLPNEVEKFSDAINDVPDKVVVRGSVDWDVDDAPIRGSGSSAPTRPRGYATGTPGLGFMDFGAGTSAMLHGREAVVPVSRKQDAAAAWGGGGATEIVVVVLPRDADVRDVFAAMPRHARRNEGQWAAKLSGELAKYGVR